MKRSFLDFGRPDRPDLRREIAGNGLIQGLDRPQMAHSVRGLRKGAPAVVTGAIA